MSGIYIHIPFASKRVITVTFIFDFDEEERGDGFTKEIQMQKRISKRHNRDYFGGGTPSVLTSDEINFLIDSVYENYEVDENPEIKPIRMICLMNEY
jgi:oxygen-independent coproporphyrinogen-3 oxidase